MISVEVGSDGDPIRVSRPEGESSVVRGEVERVCVFAEAVHIRVGWQACLDPKVLGLKNERVSGGREENLVG